jgi:hypothetical protein
MSLQNNPETVQTILRETSSALQEELGLDAEGKAIFGIFFDHVDLIVDSGIVTGFDASATLADRVSGAAAALVLFYSNSMSRFPDDFRRGLGQTFFQIAGLALGYLEKLEELMQELGIEQRRDVLELLELLPGFFLGSEMSHHNREFIERVMANSGASTPVEFLLLMLKQMGIPEHVCTGLLNESESLKDAWFKHLLTVMEADD